MHVRMRSISESLGTTMWIYYCMSSLDYRAPVQSNHGATGVLYQTALQHVKQKRLYKAVQHAAEPLFKLFSL